MAMDRDSRLILAKDMGSTRAADGVEPATEEARARAGGIPGIVPRNGAANLDKAIEAANRQAVDGIKTACQAAAHPAGNAASLRCEEPSRTIGERMRMPGTIKERGRAGSSWAS